MLAALFLSALLYQPPQPVLVDWREEYQRDIGRPMGKAGRSMGRTMDSWKGGAEEFMGEGDEAVDTFTCSDPGFFVIRQEHGASGEESWVLKGTLHVPAAGYSYRFMFLGQRGPEAFTQLQIGQPVTPQYRQRSADAPLQVAQTFKLPKGIGLLHIRVEGASPVPQEIRCDITAVKEPQPED